MNTAFIVCGSPGAGKSTHAKKLALKLHAILLDIDTVTEQLVKVALNELDHNQDDRDSEYFKKTFRESIYETLFDIAKENISFTDVIIVGPFTKEMQDFSWPGKLTRKLESKIEIHYVYCKPDIRRTRIENRANSRDIAKVQEWKRFNKYYGGEKPPVFKHLLINNSEDQDPGKASISPAPRVKSQKPYKACSIDTQKRDFDFK